MKLAQTVFLKQSFFDRHKDHKEILANKAGRHTDEKKGLPGIDFTKLPIFKFSSLQYFIDDVKSVVNSL
ncbi:hypothetical protein [Fibrobacter sp. UWB11]|uniref:hypothetical protein n=1 Tax=Fibrobacter sp. UWB11 TaxID=1896202 RepID=UPI00092601E4|nr:hypothetical protein [Fibrobacter sp. UWB11]SIO29280.1 hypothetical protein SAMN05720758_2049 [Fibrobacter sp. UWB11]